MKYFISLILCVLTIWNAFTQESEPYKTRLSGEWRTFYSATINKEDLKDFEALATGGFVKITQPLGKHWELGGALYTSVNLNLQDLNEPDPVTGGLSRYEEGLFDRLNPSDKHILHPGELYVQYQSGKHNVKVGNMTFASPLVNGQDGRMIPTFVQGMHYTFSPHAKETLGFAWVHRIAPRSTAKFFTLGESIGSYPQGRNEGGVPAQYFRNTSSDYLLIGQWKKQWNQRWDTEIWNYYTDNVSNTFYIKPGYSLHENWKLRAEWLHQNQVGNGGNSIDSLRYFSDVRSDILGIELTWQKNNTRISLGYDRILAHGKFLFPREWGREFLFSFQKRERSEGTADNHAVVLYADQQWGKKDGWGLRAIGSIGHQWKPSAADARVNKYAMPSYTQLNLDLFPTFPGLKNLQPELLFVAKIADRNTPNNPNFFFNKADMFLINVVVNYRF